jgi:hypothetical protein
MRIAKKVSAQDSQKMPRHCLYSGPRYVHQTKLGAGATPLQGQSSLPAKAPEQCASSHCYLYRAPFLLSSLLIHLRVTFGLYLVFFHQEEVLLWRCTGRGSEAVGAGRPCQLGPPGTQGRRKIPNRWLSARGHGPASKLSKSCPQNKFFALTGSSHPQLIWGTTRVIIDRIPPQPNQPS